MIPDTPAKSIPEKSVHKKVQFPIVTSSNEASVKPAPSSLQLLNSTPVNVEFLKSTRLKFDHLKIQRLIYCDKYPTYSHSKMISAHDLKYHLWTLS